jgi:flagellin
MSAVLNTNVASLWASKNLLGAQNTLASSVERLSSGLRINRARDDAAGLGVANSLTAQINGANQGVRNLNDAISMVQTAEGAIAAASQMGQRILMLATQGANGTLGLDERDAILNEMQELLSSIDSIGKRTSFSGNDLLGVSTDDCGWDTLYSMQISNASGDNIELKSSAFYNIGTGDGPSTPAISVSFAESTFDIDEGPDPAVPDQFTLNFDYENEEGDWTYGASVTFKALEDGVSLSDIVYAANQGSSTSKVQIVGGNLDDVSAFSSIWSIEQTSMTGFDLVARNDAPNFNFNRFASENSDVGNAMSIFESDVPYQGQATDLMTDVQQALDVLRDLQDNDGDYDLEDLSDAFKDIQDSASQYVIDLGTQRSQLGAYQNQMEYTLSNITELSSNLQSARSRVIDTDYASETANLTKGQILQQAATAMLAQANQMPNVILTLLK